MNPAVAQTSALTRSENPADLELYLVTVLWGDWYRRMLTEALLPTLFSPNNLPALAGRIRVKYVIHTTRHDATMLRNSPVFRRLTELTDLSITVRDDFDPRNAMNTHHRIWNEVREDAIRRKSWLFLLPPDLVCSDGSFAKIAQVMEAGKEAIYCNTIRVNSETFVGAMQKQFGSDDNVAVTAPARDLLKLALGHYHPLNIVQSPASRDFSIFEELIHFPVGKAENLEGFVLCSPISCPFFVVRPSGRLRVSANHVIVEGRDFNDLAFVSDSDDMLFLSLLPLLQYRDSYLDHGPMDVANVSKTTLEYDNILARRQAAMRFRFHFSGDAGPAWTSVDRRAVLTMSRITTRREYLRVWKSLRNNGYVKAAEVVASAVFARRHLPTVHPPYLGTLFVPNDDVLGELNLGLLKENREADLTRALAKYIVPGTIRLGDFRGRTLTVQSLAGDSIELDGRNPQPTANGWPIEGDGTDVGTFVWYGLAGRLHEGSMRNRQRSLQKAGTLLRNAFQGNAKRQPDA